MTPPQPPQSALHPARMGLEPLPREAWLRPQAGDAALLAERARLIAAHGADVLAAMPDAEAAIAELAALLTQRGIETASGDGGLFTLAAVGRAIAEDLCILTPAADGSYNLTAGVLCFPNRWRLRDKIGGTVLAVHGPVPEYAGELSTAVDRFLTRLKPERSYLRRNWGLASSPDLYLPEPTPPVDPRSDDRAMYLRCEDQSFLKLPETGAVIFSIRTTVTPWRDTPADLRTEILGVIADLNHPWLTYKSINWGQSKNS